MNDTGTDDAAAHALAQHLSGIAQGMARIADLQVRLFAVDLQTLRKVVLRTFGIWTLAFCLLVAALPTAMIGTGLLLADVAHLSAAAGLLWVVFASGLLALAMLALGWSQLNKQRTGLRRSRRELRESLNAVTHALSNFVDPATTDVFHRNHPPTRSGQPFREKEPIR